MRLVVDRIGQGFVFVLILETLVALAHAGVGDEGRYFLFGQFLDVGIGMVAGVCRDEGLVGAQGICGLDDRQQQFLFGAGAVGLGLGFVDDLVFAIDGGNAGVALEFSTG